jgi:hypothetical protein
MMCRSTSAISLFVSMQFFPHYRITLTVYIAYVVELGLRLLGKNLHNHWLQSPLLDVLPTSLVLEVAGRSFLEFVCHPWTGWVFFLFNFEQNSKKDMKDSEKARSYNRICSHNVDLETTTHTFMLHAHPSPRCPWSSVKRSRYWSCDESKKDFLRRSRFVSCVHTQVNMTP